MWGCCAGTVVYPGTQNQLAHQRLTKRITPSHRTAAIAMTTTITVQRTPLLRLRSSTVPVLLDPLELGRELPALVLDVGDVAVGELHQRPA